MNKRNSATWFVAFATLLVTAMLAFDGRAAERLETEAEYVGPLPKGDIYIYKLAASVRLHPESGRVAYPYKFDEPEKFLDEREAMRSAHVIMDGVPSKFYKLISRPFVSNDGFVFVGSTLDGLKVINTTRQTTTTFAAFDYNLMDFASQSGRLACAVSQDPPDANPREWRMLVDDQLGPPCVKFDAFSMCFDASGKRFAYKALDEGKWRVFLDGEPGPEHAANVSIGSTCFSSDGKQFAYTVWKDRKAHVVLNGQPQPTFDDVQWLGFSQIGHRWGCLVWENKRWKLVIDGKAVAEADRLEPVEGELFTADGKYCALAEDGEKKSLIYEGIKPLPFDEIKEITFSPQGGHVAYVGTMKSGDKTLDIVIRDGKRTRGYDKVDGLQFSPRGNRLACVILDQGSRLVEIDGERSEGFQYIPTGNKFLSSHIAFSDDGERFAFPAYRDAAKKMFLVVDNKVVGSWDRDPAATHPSLMQPPVFSSDGKHVACEATRDGKQILVVDGRESAEFDQFLLTPIVFESPRRVRFIAHRDGALFRVHADLEGKTVFDEKSLAKWHALGVASETADGDNQNYYEAFAWYRKAAELGHADSQKEVGKLYSLGNGVERDDAEALRWSLMAADKGHATAQSNVGVFYRDGRAVEKDLDEAIRWFRMGAEGGSSFAQSHLAYLYFEGNGVEKDETEAFKWYMMSAEQGNAFAQSWVAWMFEHGRGTSKNVAESVAWYRKAADHGHPDAMNAIGRSYANGRVVEKDLKKAKFWYRKAAYAGNEAARNNLLKLLPVRPSLAGLDPWGSETGLSTTTRYGPANNKKWFVVDYWNVTGATANGKTWQVSVPSFVYKKSDVESAVEGDTLKDFELPKPTPDEYSPPTAEQRKTIEKLHPNGTISICYPPFVAFGSDLQEQSDDTKKEIRKQLEDRYESEASKLPVKWGYWAPDGFFYSGYIDRIEGGRYRFRFDDGQTALLKNSQIAQRIPQPGDAVQGDWRRGGTYYSATVLSRTGRTVRVRYTSDGVVEDVDISQLRVRFKPAE